MIPEPDAADKRIPLVPTSNDQTTRSAPPPTDDGSGDGGVTRDDEPPNDERPDDHGLVEDDDDDDDDDHGDGNEVEPISQRLARANRGVRFTTQGSGDAVPGHAADVGRRMQQAQQRYDVDMTKPYIVYIGSAEDRPGSLREHATKSNLSVVMVDPKIGGYEHDLTFTPAVDDLEIIIRHSSCSGLFVSIPCGTWSALRYIRPGPPVLRRLASAVNAWVNEVIGIPRPDGTLPNAVQRANTLASNVARLGDVAASLDKDVAFESPVSRAKHSQFAIAGREDHAEMFTHPALERLEKEHSLMRLYFDQCQFGSDFEKTTQLVATPRLYRAMRPHFVHRRCQGGHVHKELAGEVGADGAFASEDAAAYPSEMNQSIAESYVESARKKYHAEPQASVSVSNTPISDWQRWMDDTPVMPADEEVSAEAFHVAFHPDPLQHAKAAVQVAPTSCFSQVMQWTGIDNQAFPLPAEEFAGDSPSYRDAMRGSEANEWKQAMHEEIVNLENHDAYTEIPESELPSWNGTSSSEVVNTLWVLKKKRGKDGEVERYKGRCVFDGRNQKAVAQRHGKVLNSYAPCGRPSTHKSQVAAAVFRKRRHQTFDVTGAYLKGIFNTTEVVYARPPPGERRYTIIEGRAVPVVWKLNVPLYGEVDAGYIWNRTATEQLVNKQGFKQSQNDPSYFWKDLTDGTRMDLLLYVDDAYVTDHHSKLADAELDKFGAAFADKDGKSGITVKKPDHFLGANIDVHSNGSVTVSSRAYVKQLAARYLPKPLEEYPNYLTPSARDLVEAYDQARDKVDILDDEAKAVYASKCGAAIFAGPCSRFDALYVLGMCARCLTFPTERMNRAIDRVIVYLAKTCDRGVNFVVDDPAHPTLDYEVYSDSDWCTAHSTTGTCHTIRGRVVHASSKRQQSISISSTEAEIMAASLAASEIIFNRSLLAEMGFDMSEPTVLWVDNMGAVECTKRRESLARSRHIDRRYLKILEWVAEGKIVVKYKNTKENRADMFTKPLEHLSFNEHASAVMGW